MRTTLLSSYCYEDTPSHIAEPGEQRGRSGAVRPLLEPSDELARGETVAIEVGETRGTIRLDGAAAIADFRARCSADNQRGKEVL